MTDIAHLSDEDYVAIGQAYTAYITAAGKGSVEAGEWPKVLNASLLARAIEGGYFGPIGLIPGFDYGDHKVKGAQVSGTTTGSGIEYVLTYNSEVIATETGGGDFDTVAFAARHGYQI